MIRDLLTAVFILAVAFGLGSWSAVKATEELPFYTRMTAGSWVAHPAVGIGDADPYTRAYLARTGQLPLASAEGVRFIASTDDNGRALSSDCRYRIAGETPPARHWTLHGAARGQPLEAERADVPHALASTNLLYSADGSFTISVARRPQPANWLSPGETQRFLLTMTLLDTPVASSTAPTELRLPEITRLGCYNG